MTSPRTLSKAKDSPRCVLILDHDETFANPARKSNGDYLIQEDKSINATIMDEAKLRRVATLAILFQVPIHVVTDRANIPSNRKVIEKIIDSIEGFTSSIGGFKREYIHFASIMEGGIRKSISTKAEIIKDIHRTLYPTLPKSAFLFVDDMSRYLDKVAEEGYLTFKADPINKDHFALIEEFILNCGKFYTYQPMLFKIVRNAIPSQQKELPQKLSPEIMDEGICALKRFF